jgi:hypothetical protein
MSSNNGGPAFPQMSTTWDLDKHEYVLSQNLDGMSLRDWFAGKAMNAALCSNAAMDVFGADAAMDGGKRAAEWVAASSYDIADAMLKARKA